MALVISEDWIYVILVLYAIGKIINRFGGMKIAYYRGRHIPFFSYAVKDASGERHLKSRKLKDVHNDISPPGFEDGDDGLRFWPEADISDYIDRYCGGPFLEYRWDDSRPMPISKHDGTLMDPKQIIKPYKNRSATDLNRIGLKTPRLETLSRLLIILTLLAVCASLYYQILYGQNIACAVHAAGIGGCR